MNDINMPEAKVNITLSIRNDDTEVEVKEKIHIYGNSDNEVLRSVSKSIVKMMNQIKLIDGDSYGQETRS